MLNTFNGVDAKEGDYVIVADAAPGYGPSFYVGKIHNDKAYTTHTIYTQNKGRKWLRKVSNIATVIPADNVYEEEKELIERNIAAANVYDIGDYSEISRLQYAAEHHRRGREDENVYHNE